MEDPQVEKLLLLHRSSGCCFGAVPCGIPQAGSQQVLQSCAPLE